MLDTLSSDANPVISEEAKRTRVAAGLLSDKSRSNRKPIRLTSGPG